MPKGNKDNLQHLSTEKAREIGSKGGKASVETRRRKKTMREALEMLMYKVKLPEEHRRMLEKEGFTEEDFNHQTVITRSLIAKAESGDVQAYNAICAMIGEKPADKVEMTGGLCTNLRITHVTSEGGRRPFPSSEDEVDTER